jgi:hypothetical protein
VSAGYAISATVVVRALDADPTLVEAVDPQTLVTMTHNDGLAPVADDASRRLSASVATLN